MAEYDPLGSVELEYEFLYNVRDQTMLFLELCPEKAEYAEGILVEIEIAMERMGEKMGIKS